MITHLTGTAFVICMTILGVIKRQCHIYATQVLIMVTSPLKTGALKVSLCSNDCTQWDTLCHARQFSSMANTISYQELGERFTQVAHPSHAMEIVYKSLVNNILSEHYKHAMFFLPVPLLSIHLIYSLPKTSVSGTGQSESYSKFLMQLFQIKPHS